MNGLENMMLTVLKHEPLSSRQLIFAGRLSKSEEPFEHFVGCLAMQTGKNTLSDRKNAFSPSDYYAGEALFRLCRIRTSTIINNFEIKRFVFRAAKSKRVSTRINATQVLARIAKRERGAYRLLKGLKSDKNELVRHNARILFGKLSS